MSLSLNKPKLDNLAGDIWKSAERLRGKFKAYEYQNIVLPIIVIRRLECVLIKWREDKAAEVLSNRPTLTEHALAKLVKGLEISTAPFWNRTDKTLRSVYEEDHTLLEENFRDYINGFSPNVDDIIEHFNYRGTIGQMVKNNRLAPILNQYKELELGPDKLSPLEMGYIYEELLRRFSEQSGEEAGEHFTPREVIRLMVELLDIPVPERHISIYDPACGTGGMLSVAKEHLLDRAATPEQRDSVERLVTVHGQEMSPTNYYIWLLRNDKPASHRGRVMLIDARQQYEKEPRSFGNKRNRISDSHRAWIQERYREGWEDCFVDEQVKCFRREDFAYHKVSVVFWQLDEEDRPATVTEPYEKAFTAANLKKEQEFYDSELTFRVRLKIGETETTRTLTLGPKDNAARQFKALMQDKPQVLAVDWTHRHYVKDDEYIPFGEDIEAFLDREIAKPIIRWQDSPQLGYEILPNKYFYRYQPPKPADELLAEFWRLEKEAETLLEGLAQ